MRVRKAMTWTNAIPYHGTKGIFAYIYILWISYQPHSSKYTIYIYIYTDAMGYALVILSFVFDMSGEKHSDFEQTRVLQRSFLRILGQYTTLLNQVTPILESHVNH